VGEAVRLLPRIALLRGQPGDSGSSLLDRLDQALVQLQRARRGGCSGPMAATAPARAARPCSKPT
jgi:hypothetical protein